MLVRYNRESRLWEVRQAATATPNTFGRIVVDAPAAGTIAGDFVFEESDCEMRLEAGGSALRIARKVPVPGVVKEADHREWCVVRTEQDRRWLVFRQDKQDVVVTTDVLSLDCHAITTADGMLHCKAEMLAVGATNREESITDARSVKLRTLSIYDQTIEVPLISMRASARGVH